MGLPWLHEVLKLVATGGTGFAVALNAGMNFEGGEQLGDGASGDGTVCIPGAGGEALHPFQQQGGGETLGVAVIGKAVAEVGQQLHAVAQIEYGLFFKEADEGLADAGGPFAADGAGELQQWFAHIPLAWGEVGRKVFQGIGGVSGQIFLIFQIFRYAVSNFLQELGIHLFQS